jgi:hypothetical protein
MGFRSFDLNALLGQELDRQPGPVIGHAQFLARSEAAQTQSTQDAQRWSDDGGRTGIPAMARPPAPN